MAEKVQRYLDSSIKEFKFEYSGPVLMYGKVISNNFKANTIATTQKRAIVNIKDQYKRWNGLGKRAPIDIKEENVICIGEYEQFK